jgi:hypothetical protein
LCETAYFRQTIEVPMMRIKVILAAFCLLSLTVTAAGCAGTVTAPPPVSAPPSASPASSPTLSPTPATSGEPSQSPGGAGLSEDAQQKAIEDFKVLLKSAGAEKAALAALRHDLPGMSAENAAEMVLEFEAYQNDAVLGGTIVSDALVTLIQTAAPGIYDEETLNDIEAIKDAGLRKALGELFDRGYKLIVPEGNFQAVTDYGVYKEFGSYLPADIAAYISVKASESDSRMAEDGGIIIPVDEVLARALACESFVATYPDSAKRDEVKTLYGWYVDAYFFGMNNTPAFDYQTNKLRSEFLDSYSDTTLGPAADELIKARAEYLKMLQENDFTLTPAVAEYRKSLTNQLKNTTAWKG